MKIMLNRIYTIKMSVPTTLNKNAQLPTRGDPFAAGLDLYASEDHLVTKKQTLVSTGVAMAIPEGYFGNIRSRSGMAYKHGVFTEAGIIDSSYRGEIKVLMYTNSEDYQIKKGDRIAQLIIQPYSTMNPVQVNTLDTTERGNGGFGSTGK